MRNVRLTPGNAPAYSTSIAVFHQRLYAGTELEALARRAGFAQVTLHGWFDGARYDHTARRLVMVATAP